MRELSPVTVHAVINTNPENAWDCYTLPQHITQWNFAHESWKCPSAINDVKDGGKLNWRMEACDGSMGFNFEAVYTTVVKNQTLNYTMLDNRMVSISFKSITNLQTEVRITFDLETENSEELQRSGWQAILDNYKKHAESVNQ